MIRLAGFKFIQRLHFAEQFQILPEFQLGILVNIQRPSAVARSTLIDSTNSEEKLIRVSAMSAAHRTIWHSAGMARTANRP